VTIRASLSAKKPRGKSNKKMAYGVVLLMHTKSHLSVSQIPGFNGARSAHIARLPSLLNKPAREGICLRVDDAVR
jgi:hypothetical protein